MDCCPIIRTKLITHGTLSMSGEGFKESRKEWKTEECGTPLFKDKATICRSCATGWNHENNFIVESEENTRLISEAVINQTF